ncbi:MAG: hypothetical protein C4576_03785 [Desulfobacteraceae bacterium]|nr:MAG: hypothetical protein C4576_03785 [Desulfobacteraceae bacterium]
MKLQALYIALYILAAGGAATIWVVLRGPTMADRLIAASSGVNILTFILAVCGAIKGSEFYYDAALAAALLSISSAIIIAKFIATRRVM